MYSMVSSDGLRILYAVQKHNECLLPLLMNVSIQRYVPTGAESSEALISFSQPQVFKEIHRCLRPGGVAIMSFSNRCFPTKAIAIWTQTGDLDHVWIVGSYFHYSVPGGFEAPFAKVQIKETVSGVEQINNGINIFYIRRSQLGLYLFIATMQDISPGPGSDPMFVVSGRKL